MICRHSSIIRPHDGEYIIRQDNAMADTLLHADTEQAELCGPRVRLLLFFVATGALLFLELDLKLVHDQFQQLNQG